MFTNIAVEMKYNEGIKKIANKLFNALQQPKVNLEEVTNQFQISFAQLQYARAWADEIVNDDMQFDMLTETPP